MALQLYRKPTMVTRTGPRDSLQRLPSEASFGSFLLTMKKRTLTVSVTSTEPKLKRY